MSAATAQEAGAAQGLRGRCHGGKKPLRIFEATEFWGPCVGRCWEVVDV